MTKAKAQCWLKIGGAFAVLAWMAYLTYMVVEVENVAGDGCLYAWAEYEQIHAQLMEELNRSYRPFPSPCLIDRRQPS